ncbi:hypothetical protein EPN83_01650 [Patescibacteria group bacterium]|nr:MAG: hypothetical protein EPN83_01650 [Patescibacteria group bacterium]
MKYLFIIAVLIAATVPLTLYPRRSAEPIDERTLEPQASDAGGVTITVKPQISKSAEFWNFEVTLSTHSVELNEDLVSTSTLIDENGKQYKPLSWQGDPPGGHHRGGVIRFNSINPPPERIELQIKNIGGIPLRSFEWSLR